MGRLGQCDAVKMVHLRDVWQDIGVLTNPSQFSVVIPLFDKVETIQGTIASVLAQTVSPIEVIVVDDGSTDGGDLLVSQMMHPAIRLIMQMNAGPGGARNRGIGAARGDWVALLDGDDLWTPDHLANLADVIDGCRDADLVSSASRVVRSSDELAMPSRVHSQPAPPRTIEFFREYHTELLNASSVAIRRTAFVETGGFGNTRSGEDLAYWISFAVDHRIAVSDRPTALYVRGTNGIMEREQRTRRSGIPMPPSPVITAIDVALINVEPSRRPIVRAFADRTRLQYSRSEIYLGRYADARRLLSGVVERQALYWFYRLLTLVPHPLLRIALLSRSASRIMRMPLNARPPRRVDQATGAPL